VVKLLVGLLKGAVIGGAVGYGAYSLAQATDFSSAWLTYGLIGALVGLFVGRPLWSLLRDKNATAWIAVLKGAFGFGIGCGIYALVAKAWGPSEMKIAGYDFFSWPPMLGGAIGAVYGAFVELDDAIGDDKAPPKKELSAAGSKPVAKPVVAKK
jgi:hypothetical protein